MKLPKILEIKDTGEQLEPGKLAIAGMMICAIVIALIVYSKKGYYDTGYSKGEMDLLECYTRTVISISISVFIINKQQNVQTVCVAVKHSCFHLLSHQFYFHIILWWN